ncbi:MAG: hypothetical protein HC831_19000, partial [Chloroflexia bacterium]|nr:hypothetical protein [Chloroflexia bacterium]
MSDQRFFQYLRGERKGEVVILNQIIEEDGDVFIEFKDLSRMNENFIVPLNGREIDKEDIMAEVSDPVNVWKFEESIVGAEPERWSAPEDSPDGKRYLVSPAKEGKKKIKIIPPRKVKSNLVSINQSITTLH